MAQRCPVCAHQIATLRLYDPKHFIWLGMLLGFLVPVYLAASNWGRLGRRDLQRGWLLGGTLGLASLLSALSLLPEIGRVGGAILGYAFNYPLCYLLRVQQKPLFASHVHLGARRASMFQGIWPALGLVVLAVLPAFGVLVLLPDRFDNGVRLLDEKRYSEAARQFELALEMDPANDAARFNAGLSAALAQEWDGAEKRLRECVERQPADAKTHAYLGYVLDHRGKNEEAVREYHRADSLEAGVLNRVLGSR